MFFKYNYSVRRQMLFCRVTLGKSFLQFSAMKMAHAPPGHHSVIGRPSVNGLAYAEYVIYRGEQVRELRYKHIFSGSRYPVDFKLYVCYRHTQSTSSHTRSSSQTAHLHPRQQRSRRPSPDGRPCQTLRLLTKHPQTPPHMIKTSTHP